MRVGQVVKVADAPDGGIVRALDYQDDRVLVALNPTTVKWYPASEVEVPGWM